MLKSPVDPIPTPLGGGEARVMIRSALKDENATPHGGLMLCLLWEWNCNQGISSWQSVQSILSSISIPIEILTSLNVTCRWVIVATADCQTQRIHFRSAVWAKEKDCTVRWSVMEDWPIIWFDPPITNGCLISLLFWRQTNKPSRRQTVLYPSFRHFTIDDPITLVFRLLIWHDYSNRVPHKWISLIIALLRLRLRLKLKLKFEQVFLEMINIGQKFESWFNNPPSDGETSRKRNRNINGTNSTSELSRHRLSKQFKRKIILESKFISLSSPSPLSFCCFSVWGFLMKGRKFWSSLLDWLCHSLPVTHENSSKRLSFHSIPSRKYQRITRTTKSQRNFSFLSHL